MWRAIGTTLAVGSVACSEYEMRTGVDDGRNAVPDIVVDPPLLAYGSLKSGEEQVLTFTVENVGASTLRVSDVGLETGAAFTVLGPRTAFHLEPGESTWVDVAFTPLEADENVGRVLVASDDPDSPSVPVDLIGTGAVPELRITPSSFRSK